MMTKPLFPMLLVMVLLWGTAMLSGCAGGGGAGALAPPPGAKPIPLTVAVVDFADQREFETQTASFRRSPPFAFYKGWRFARPDQVYSGSIEPFPSLMAKEFADALRESRQFEKVVRAKSLEELEPGAVDLVLSGRIDLATARGKAYYYGLSFPFDIRFYDILWAMGFPKFSRTWEYDLTFQLSDAYTGEKLGPAVRVQQDTSRKYFTQYVEEGRMKDFFAKSRAVWSEAVAQSRQELPGGDDASWAALRADGQEMLAAAKREQERMARGALPTFTFLTPADGAVLRMPTTRVQWSATAGNGLRGLTLTLNGVDVATGVDTSQARDESTAIRSVSTREVEASLRMGENVLEAQLEDFRDNRESARLVITRLPAALDPARRHGLLLHDGSASGRASADALAAALSSPIGGQFAPADVQVVDASGMSPAELTAAVTSFATRPLSGELALVYVAMPAQAGALVARGGEVPLAGLLGALEPAFATDRVVLVMDPSGAPGEAMAQAAAQVPSRWALLVADASGKGSPVDGATTALAGSLARQLTEEKDLARPLSLEQFLDDAAYAAEQAGAEPALEGRFDRNLPMRQYR